MAKGYPFECERKLQDHAILIKTHKPDELSFRKLGRNISLPFAKRLVERMPEYHRAVLHRNPYEFLVANIHSQHLDEVPEKAFAGKKWRSSQHKLFQYWQDINHYWLHEFKGPVLPVLYSRLRHDVAGELKRILDFMHVNVTELDIKCAQANGEGNFHRKPRKWTKINSIVDLFPEDFQRRINASVTEHSKH